MIWFAGGDQYNNVSYFKDKALVNLIGNHVNVKHAPIGGTSAGMAILGNFILGAERFGYLGRGDGQSIQSIHDDRFE